MRLSRHLRYGFCLVAPIFFALTGCSQAQVAPAAEPQIAQIPPPSTTRLDPPANYVTQKNKVIMLGLIHSGHIESCLLYTSPSPRDQRGSRMPSSA